jgi:ketosteroid isomerase-like protein
MSQENVDIVRRGYEAMNSGDVEGTLAMFDPEIEVHLAQDAGTVMGLDFERTYRGVDGFLEFLGQLSEAWEEFRWEPEGFADAGDDVVVFIRMTAKGKASGLEVVQPMAHLCTIRQGKLVRHETFWERDAALDAAGLASD